MKDTFISLPDSKKKQVTSVITNACLIMSVGGEWRKVVKIERKKSKGKVKSILSELEGISNQQLNHISEVLTDGLL